MPVPSSCAVPLPIIPYCGDCHATTPAAVCRQTEWALTCPPDGTSGVAGFDLHTASSVGELARVAPFMRELFEALAGIAGGGIPGGREGMMARMQRVHGGRAGQGGRQEAVSGGWRLVATKTTTPCAPNGCPPTSVVAGTGDCSAMWVC